MKSRITVAALVLLLAAACGGGKAQEGVDELKRKNEDLAARVKILEDRLLESEKKDVQHQQALQTMHERLRNMEAELDRARMGVSR